MSTLKKMILSLGFVIAILGFTRGVTNAQGRSVSLQVFYDELSYYGDWINNPEYGYVWRPNVGSDFRPYYTNGRWVMTQYGNTWVSDYEWGWAPFHYGRWYYDSYDGWVWVPDTVWGPAWVDWRTGGGYYGWAPMEPRLTVSINIGPRYYPDFYWVFIPQRYIYYNNYGSYWRPGRNVTIIKNTTIINNVYVNNNVRYVSGPSVRDVRRATGSNVHVYNIQNASRPGSARVDRNSLSVYRPQIDRGRDARPSRVISDDHNRPSRVDNNNTRPGRGDGVSTRPSRENAPSRNAPDRTSNTPQRSDREHGTPGTRPSRESAPSGNAPDRTSNAPQRPDREHGTPATRPSRENTPSGNSGNIPDRTSSRRPEREVPREGAPARAERPQEQPQRQERPAPQERRPAERRETTRENAPQRQERPQQSAPAQRVERQSAPARSEGRSTAPHTERGGERGGSSGRPSR